MSTELYEILASLGAPGKVGLGLLIAKATLPKLTDRVDAGLATAAGSIGGAILKATEIQRDLFARAFALAANKRDRALLTRSPKANVVVPLLEAALLEENDHLRSMWAEMLLNSMDTQCPIEITRKYISLLQDCSPLDADILAKIHEAYLDRPAKRVWTMLLPREVFWDSDDRARERMNEHPSRIAPSAEVRRSLWNLHRLGLIGPAVQQQGDYSLNMVEITSLGVGLVEACTAS